MNALSDRTLKLLPILPSLHILPATVFLLLRNIFAHYYYRILPVHAFLFIRDKDEPYIYAGVSVLCMVLQNMGTMRTNKGLCPTLPSV